MFFTNRNLWHKLGVKTDCTWVISKKLLFTLRYNGSKIVFHFCWGKATEALFITHSKFDVIFCHLAFKTLLQTKKPNFFKKTSTFQHCQKSLNCSQVLLKIPLDLKQCFFFLSLSRFYVAIVFQSTLFCFMLNERRKKKVYL